MGLTSGTRLGPYEIVAPIGAGGMGEVYRARDSRLGRDVAVKGLPEAFARDAERLSRFQREAKVLASLNHPNIASIYGLEDSGPTHALVMIESLAAEVKPYNINVNSIVPSIFDTAANRKEMPKADFSKWPKPEQIARVVLFLCSEDARLVHGAAVPVYGHT